MSKVELYMYDITNFLEKLVGVDEVWHTSIVTYGKELSYNSSHGIQVVENPCAPTKIENLGRTTLSWPQVMCFVNSLAANDFTVESYRTLNNNCNNFSDTLSQFLCGRRINQSILYIPDRIVMQTIGAVAAGTVTVAAATGGRCSIV